MTEQTLIEFEPGSGAGPFDLDRILQFQQFYGSTWTCAIRFPESYIAMHKTCHGGIPVKKSFLDVHGTERVVGRFLNFLVKKDLDSTPRIPSWRTTRGDGRLDYSIWLHGYMGDRLGPMLVPIAGIDTKGHDCKHCAAFDMLCLDFSNATPTVVAWNYEKSWSYPVISSVCSDFDTFLRSLFVGRHPCLAEPARQY